MSITLAYALKVTRRGIYQYSAEWRALLVVKSERAVPVLWDEVKSLMDASSLGIEMARYATRIMQMERGGTIKFAAIDDLTDAYCHVSGRSFTHIVWLCVPDPKVEEYVKTRLRSSTVPTEHLRIDYADW